MAYITALRVQTPQVHTEPAEYLRIYASYVYRTHKQGSRCKSDRECRRPAFCMLCVCVLGEEPGATEVMSILGVFLASEDGTQRKVKYEEKKR